jgi:diamine N-acetyltransferase
MNIHLRALEPEDLDVLYRIENDRELWQAGTTNVPYSRYVLHDYIANTSNDIYADRQLRLMIEDDNARVVGIVDLMNFDPRHNRAEVGLVIQRPFRCQGYAQATLPKLAHYAAHILHLHQLYAVVRSDNHVARSVFQKMGYKETVTLSDWLYDGRQYAEATVLQLLLA